MSTHERLLVKDKTEFLGVGNLAERYRRTRQAVHVWIKKHGPSGDSVTPMPAPAAIIRQGNGYSNYGWSIEQLPELDAWVEEHTNSGGRKVEAGEE